MYRTLDAAFWTDPKIRPLAADAKLFAVYLISNPHSHVGGIYYLPNVIVCEETGFKSARLDTLWDTLSDVGFSLRDKENQVVWVKKMFFYQGRGDKNARAVANTLPGLHKSRLINDFLQMYPEVLKHVPDRVSIGYSELGKSGPPNRTGTEQDQDQDQDIVGVSDPSAAHSEIATAWNSAPGAIPIRSLTDARTKALRVRLKDSSWDWQSALKKFPLRCFASQPDGWKPSFDWFLKPDTVTAILEGKYDWTKKENQNGKQPTLPIGSGQTHDPDAAGRDPDHGRM